MKIKNLLILFVSVITLSSCAFTEEIHIKNDGSGSYAFKMDMGKMMEAMGEMGSQDNDSIKKKAPEKMDSTVYFKDIIKEYKDSIAKLDKDEQEMMKSLEDLKMRIQMDEEKKQMKMDFIFDFKNITELKNINDRIQKAQALNEKKKKKKSGFGDMFDATTDVTYSFENNTFKRTVAYKKGITEEDIAKEQEMLKGSSEMFNESTYKIAYHFEEKIKSVSLKEAKISNNGKTVTIEMPMDTIIKNPFLLNFEVKLK